MVWPKDGLSWDDLRPGGATAEPSRREVHTMTTSLEKFRKLLAAYEDEVQRRQHKMGKRVDPRDEAVPNWTTGYITFLRGQDVMWSPSFELIGTYDPAAGSFSWGWADPTIDPKLKGRIDLVRVQGLQWGIDVMTNESVPCESEQQAWEFAIVASAVARGDAMYRLTGEDGQIKRFLALFDGPPTSRSSTTMRAVRPESQSQIPAARASVPPMSRMSSPGSGFVSALSGPPSSVVPPSSLDDREPTTASRTEIGQRLYEAVPYGLRAELGHVDLVARAVPPSGPVGAVSIDVKLTLKPASGAADIPMQPSGGLQDALSSLWMRCRDRTGAGFRFATARLETTAMGLTTNVLLEY